MKNSSGNVKLQAKVRNELMYGICRMKFDFHVMRTIKKNMREDEYKTSNRYLDSTMLFNRLSYRMQNPEKDIRPFKRHTVSGTGKIIHKSQDAVDKILGSTAQSWGEKHGNLLDTKASVQISKIIFEVLDHENKGFVRADAFCKFLIEIGLTLDCKNIEAILCKMRHCRSISSALVAYEDVVALCRGDYKSNALLSALNNTILLENKLSRKQKPTNRVIVIDCLLRKWWREMDINKYNQVHYSTVNKFLLEKEVAQDFNEANKMTQEVSIDGYMDFMQFQSIFGRSMVSFLLMSLKDKFTSEDWENPNLSYAYKMSQLKRQFILAGIHYPVPNISLEEGIAMLDAVEKYSKLKDINLVKMSYDTFKKVWLELTENELGKTGMAPNSNLDEVKVEESRNNLNRKYLNTHALLGNYHVGSRNKNQWSHSLSHGFNNLKKKKKNVILIDSQEIKCHIQNKTLEDFNRLVNYEVAFNN